jgi:hypothetical protein
VFLIVQKIKSVFVQTQLNSTYYVELHVSTYLKSSSDSESLKHIEEEIYFFVNTF